MVDLSRYQKQALFHGVGAEGQARLADRTVLIVGCGALGCVSSDALVRAGVGCVRIVDRDYVELTNLQRQTLYTEQDVAEHLPKAVCAARRLKAVNSSVTIETHVEDVDYRNIARIADGVDLIVDATDNFEVRYLLNDYALDSGTPWVFAGCTGAAGQILPVFPGVTACLRCLMPDPPPPGAAETCDTAGVLGPAIGVVASLQASAAIRILSSPEPLSASSLGNRLTIVDAWDFSLRTMNLESAFRAAACPACFNAERLWLTGRRKDRTSVLCGRNSVQIRPSEPLQLSLEQLAAKLEVSGEVTRNPFLIRLKPYDTEVELTIFPDGRCIVKGTEEISAARNLFARYVGS